MSVPWMDDEIVPRTIVYGGKTHKLEFREYPALQRQAYEYYVYRHLWEYISNEAGLWILHNIVLPALLYDSFIVYQFYGKSLSGKSWLAIAKALEVKYIEEESGLYEDVHIHYVFTHAEIGKLLRNMGKKDVPRDKRAESGDIIVCDEESALSGQGSGVTEGALANVLKACRALSVHFFFSDPNPSPKPNVDACFRVCAIARTANVTVSILEDAENKPIGFDVTEIPVGEKAWEEEIARYLPLKMANIRKIVATGGFVGTDTSSGQIEDAERLLAYAETTGKSVTKELLKAWVANIGITPMGVAYCANVVARAFSDYKQSKKQDIALPSYAGQTENLQEAIFARLLERKVKEEHVEMLRMNCSGVAQDVIAKKFGVMQGTVSKRIRMIGEKQVGYAFEDVWSAMLTRRSVKHKMGGANTPDPDCIIYDSEGEPVEVLSLKCRINHRRGFNVEWKDIAASEREFSSDFNVPLYLVAYDIINNRLYDKVEVTDQERFTFRVGK